MSTVLIIFWMALCVLLVGAIFLNIIYLRTTGNQTITISDKGIKVDSYSTENGTTGQSVYMVYARSGEVFVNRNSLWYGKWRSDELQGKLKKGHTYRIKTCGFRVPFLGMHKNILSAREVKSKK